MNVLQTFGKWWSASKYDAFIAAATLCGIALHNMVLFGKNIESYNWGLITLLVVFEIAWMLHKSLDVVLEVRLRLLSYPQRRLVQTQAFIYHPCVQPVFVFVAFRLKHGSRIGTT